MPLLILNMLALLFVAWMIGGPRWTEHRRRALRTRPFPAAWRRILRQHVPYVRRLPAALQLQLKQHIQVFLAEKPFIGCGGLTVTDEMRVTIAAQACLLLLNRPADYFPGLRQVLVYPGAFVVDKVHSDGSGVLQSGRQALLGESWSQGQVILSWQGCLEGAATVDDGRNVVIHEFAHQLDQANGHANGAPPIRGCERRKRWAEVMTVEFERLQVQADAELPTLLSHYGASHPAEFFAVASEVFFEQPQPLNEAHPSLYAELRSFYAVDPLGW